MKNYSSLQEAFEHHDYYLSTGKGYDFRLSEVFKFKEKRKNEFPSVRTRKGVQYIYLYDNDNNKVSETVFFDVLEAATERKKNIYKFLRPFLKDIQKYNCVLRI